MGGHCSCFGVCWHARPVDEVVDDNKPDASVGDTPPAPIGDAMPEERQNVGPCAASGSGPTKGGAHAQRHSLPVSGCHRCRAEVSKLGIGKSTVADWWDKTVRHTSGSGNVPQKPDVRVVAPLTVSLWRMRNSKAGSVHKRDARVVVPAMPASNAAARTQDP